MKIIISILSLLLIISCKFDVPEKPTIECQQGSNETRIKYKELNANTCQSENQTRSCVNKKWGNWDGTFLHDECNPVDKKIALLQTIDLGEFAARPELVVTKDRAFVIYLDTSTNNHQVRIYTKDFSLELSEITMNSNNPQYGICTDIRIDSDGEHLFAFYEHVSKTTKRSYLFGEKYQLNDSFDLKAKTEVISTSGVFSSAQNGDEFLDDPMVLVDGNEIISITRYKEDQGMDGKTIYKVYKFSKDLSKIEEFDLDLSSVANGSARQASIKKVNGLYYILLPSTINEPDPQYPIMDNTIPANILLVKLNTNWQIIDSKLISENDLAIQNYMTGFDYVDQYFYVGHKEIPLPLPLRSMSAQLKIFDNNFNLILEETVLDTVPDSQAPENLRISIEVTKENIYYLIDNKIYVYENII